MNQQFNKEKSKKTRGLSNLDLSALLAAAPYGPGEGHKEPMASLAYHLDRQFREQGAVRIFSCSHGFGDGEQRRDFVYIADVVAVCLWFQFLSYGGPPFPLVRKAMLGHDAGSPL